MFVEISFLNPALRGSFQMFPPLCNKALKNHEGIKDIILIIVGKYPAVTVKRSELFRPPGGGIFKVVLC